MQYIKNHILLCEIPSNAKICIYGAGSAGRLLFDLLCEQRPEIEIVCFADSYKTGIFLERPVISLDQIKDRIHKLFDLVLIASHAVEKILVLRKCS